MLRTRSDLGSTWRALSVIACTSWSESSPRDAQRRRVHHDRPAWSKRHGDQGLITGEPFLTHNAGRVVIRAIPNSQTGLLDFVSVTRTDAPRTSAHCSRRRRAAGVANLDQEKEAYWRGHKPTGHPSLNPRRCAARRPLAGVRWPRSSLTTEPYARAVSLAPTQPTPAAVVAAAIATSASAFLTFAP
jgi:hypothetical protein